MNTKVNLQTILIVIMVCVTVIVSTNSYANAQGGGEGQIQSGSIAAIPIVPGGPGYIMVSPYEFRYLDYNDIEKIAYINGLFSNRITADASILVRAGVNLPHGATITQLTVYFMDSIEGSNLEVTLYRSFSNGESSYMAYVNSDTGALSVGSNFTTSILDPKVDNRQYSYFIQVIIPEKGYDLRLTNVRIDYEYTVSAPLIMK